MKTLKQTEKSITVSNRHFSFTLDKETGNVTEFTNLYTMENIVALPACPFLYIKSEDETILLPKNVKAENSNLIFVFDEFDNVEIKVEVFDNFMTFEVMSALPLEAYSLFFANFKTEYDTTLYRFNAIAMTSWALPEQYSPCGEFKEHSCRVNTYFASGTKGSKYGICFSKVTDALDHVKEMADHIDTKVGLISKSGAPFAKDWKPNTLDYAITSAITDENLDETIKICKTCGAEELDIHMSTGFKGNTFIQGTFDWIHYKDQTEFYEKYGKKLHENGMIYGLHSYSSYLSPDAKQYVTDPYWQKQLLTVETYTLKTDVSIEDGDFPTIESAAEFNPWFPGKPYSRYLLIDEEIVMVDEYTENGFFKCLRGELSTKSAPHKAGTKVYQLATRYSMFIPKYGSPLFYEVADNMAKAYNDGNFDMLYFDALDGMFYDSNFFKLPECAYRYYAQMYMHRVISQCKRTPVFESAAGAPQEYNIRGRVGAHDTSSRAIKMTIKSHSKMNLEKIKKNNVVATLGWFSFFPDENPTLGMKNTIQKTIFHDDLDYLGLYSVMHDQTMVYESMPNLAHQFHLDNINYFQTYARLRKSGYFTQKTKDKLIEMGGEFKLVSKDGEYLWQQMAYNKANLGNIVNEDSYSFEGVNPYGAQKPFVRLESRWSTEFENGIKLIDFDENKKLSEQNLLNKGLNLDITNNMVLKFKVKGTGRDTDALLITMRSVPSHWSDGRTDFFVDLNFEGWREFVMLDADNAEYNIEKYDFGPEIPNMAGAWSTIRMTPGYDQIGSINLYLAGDTAGNAQISSIYGYTQVQDSVTNPTVEVADSAITFNTTVKGGEYIEYEPETNTALLYHNTEQTVEKISFTGSVCIPEGAYSGNYKADSQTKAPLRAKVVFGFKGITVDNIK